MQNAVAIREAVADQLHLCEPHSSTVPVKVDAECLDCTIIDTDPPDISDFLLAVLHTHICFTAVPLPCDLKKQLWPFRGFWSCADPSQIQIVSNTTSGGSPQAAGGPPQIRHLLQQGSNEAANVQIQIRPTPDQARPCTCLDRAPQPCSYLLIALFACMTCKDALRISVFSTCVRACPMPRYAF